MRIIFGRFSELEKRKARNTTTCPSLLLDLYYDDFIKFYDNGAKALIANVAIAVNTVIKIKKVLVLEITSFPPINAFIL